RLELVDVKGFEEVLLTFGDNVYPFPEKVTLGASVRPYKGTHADALDGYRGGKWVDRLEKPDLKLAGWVLLSAKQWATFLEGLDLVDGLNRANVAPIELPAQGWWDCGTEDSYKDYLEHG